MSGIQIIKSGGTTVSAYLKLAGGVALSSSLVSVVDQADNVSPLQLATASAQFVAPLFLSVPAWTLGGARSNFILTSTVASAAAGANTYKMINNVYTINNTAAQTGTITGIFQNATQTNLNGITHNLIDLQIASSTIFRVNNVGSIFTNNFALSRDVSTGADGNVVLSNSGVTNFGLLKFGGTTSSFPAIKRNGAAIDFRLADDSNYIQINASIFQVGGSATQLQVNQLLLAGLNTIQYSTRMYFDGDNRGSSFGGSVSMASANVAAAASAQLDVVSTTKGFLMPRMTQAQILAILLPANGLMVYNTDINTPCFYDGGTLLWKKVSHSNM